jgi:hypothetical protein
VVGAQQKPADHFHFRGTPLIARYFAAFLFWSSLQTNARHKFNVAFGGEAPRSRFVVFLTACFKTGNNWGLT